MATALLKMLIGFVIITVGITGINLLYGEALDTYSVTPDQNLSDMFDQINESKQKSEEITAKLLNVTTSDENSITQMAKGAFQGIKLTLESMGDNIAIINQLAKFLQIPSFIVSGIITMLILSVVISIIFLILRVT